VQCSEIVAACFGSSSPQSWDNELGEGNCSASHRIGRTIGGTKTLQAVIGTPSNKNIHRRQNAEEKDDWGVRPIQVMKLRRWHDLTNSAWENTGIFQWPVDHQIQRDEKLSTSNWKGRRVFGKRERGIRNDE
jgi:hypothetical protein